MGKNSAIGKIKELLSKNNEETPLQKKLDKIATDIGKFGLVAATITLIVLVGRLIWDLHTGDGWDSEKHPAELVSFFIIAVNLFIRKITIIVVAIPEGLPLAVTLSLAYAVKQMMKKNNLVRRLHACETMGGADCICSDKTGTLTQNKMELTHFWNVKLVQIFKSQKNEFSPLSEFIPSGRNSERVFEDLIIANSCEEPVIFIL